MAVGQDAEGTKEWDRFWGSGKVEDYLRYKSCSQRTGTEKDRADCGDRSWEIAENRDKFT